MAMTPKMRRRFLVILFMFLLVFGIIVLTGDFQKNFKEIQGFQWQYLPLALGLVLVNFTLRELKWDFFRRRAGVEAPRLASFLIFFSGYSMCVSPGRIGELIKPVMYHEYFGTRLHKTIPLVFCERLTDLLGMMLICAVTFLPFAANVAKFKTDGAATGAASVVIAPGAAEPESTTAGLTVTADEATTGGLLDDVLNRFEFNSGALLALLTFCIVLLGVAIALVRIRPLVYGILDLLGRWPKLEGLVHKVRDLYDSTYSLLTAFNLISMTLFAVFSWFFECLGAWVLSRYGLGIETVTLIDIMFIFCLASITGGLLFFLPGGLLGFEAMMIGMYKMLAAPGRVVTILVRLATLFFGVLVGVISIAIATRYFHKSVQWDELEHIAEEVEAEEAGKA